MSIYRKYEWWYRGIHFFYEQEWPDDWIRILREAPHDIKEVRKYHFYVFNDPFENQFTEFLENILEMGSNFVELNTSKDQLEYLLAFCQYLNYYHERGEYPKYPMETLIDKGGDCEDTAIFMARVAYLLDYDYAFLDFPRHADLGIVPKYSGEFYGTYWKHNGKKYFYVSCNGKGCEIGNYNGEFGNLEDLHTL